MLLAADIGNTSLVAGIYDCDRLIGTSRLVSKLDMAAEETSSFLGGLLKTHDLEAAGVDRAVIGSVVPKLTPLFENACREAFGVEEVVCLGPLTDEVVSQELKEYGGELPRAASMHMVKACDPGCVIEPDAYGQNTRLIIRGKEVHLNFDVTTMKPSEEALALWGQPKGQA